jgi:hypothetical protein
MFHCGIHKVIELLIDSLQSVGRIDSTSLPTDIMLQICCDDP